MKVGSSISVSFWLRMPGHGGADARSRNGRFCVPWAKRTRAVAPYLLCEELAVILVQYLGVGVALALTLARLLLRDFGPLVPRLFLPVMWWRCRPGLTCPARLDISLLQAWCLVLGPGFLVCRLPSVSLPWVGLVRWLCMSPLFEMLSVLFPGNIGSHFLGISRSVFGNVCFLLFLELQASSCPGSYGREGGSAGLGLHLPASMAPDPATRPSG